MCCPDAVLICDDYVALVSITSIWQELTATNFNAGGIAHVLFVGFFNFSYIFYMHKEFLRFIKLVLHMLKILK